MTNQVLKLIVLKEAIKEWERVVTFGAGNPEVKLVWRKLEEALEETDSDKEKI